MKVTAVDNDCNLFQVENFVPLSLVEKILNTKWLDLDYEHENNQLTWKRRKIKESSIPWFWEWRTLLETAWKVMIQQLGPHAWPYKTYPSSTFWLDEPGFECPVHTDGELPGAVQIYWVGSADQGTVFYHNKDAKSTRHKFEFKPNYGYAMINVPNQQQYRKLQWHGMTTTVPLNSYRISSYIIATPEGGIQWD